MAGNWHKWKVSKLGNDYDFHCKFTPPDDEKPDRVLTYGYFESEWANFGEFRSMCNREVKITCDSWTEINTVQAEDVTEDFENQG